MKTVLITGNTFPVKDQLKTLGARWNAEAKGWEIPIEKAEEARTIVKNGSSTTTTQNTYRPRKCVVCGHVEKRQGPHGRYPDPDRILKSGECVSCYEERKMGY